MRIALSVPNHNFQSYKIHQDLQLGVLETVVGSNTTPQNRFVRWGLPPLINTLSSHLLLGLVRWHKWWVAQ